MKTLHNYNYFDEKSLKFVYVEKMYYLCTVK